MRITDQRVKKHTFPLIFFFAVFFVLMLLAIGQSLMLTNYYDSGVLPPEFFKKLIIYWAVVSALFSLLTSINIRRHYERPLLEMSKVTKRVAEGDFSARVEIPHEEGRLDYMDVMFMDFNKMIEELGSIEVLKNDFVANVSHEIKTPLAVIQNYITLMQNEDITSEQRKEYADIIFNASEQLTSLVTNVLRLSKLENQAIVPAPQQYDICRQLSDCVLNFADKLEEKQIEFTAEIEDKAWLYADESMLEMIWNNLLSNAVKFTEPGGKIELIQSSDKNTVTISIRDNGCGMGAETMKHIFDKFYQEDTSHFQKGNGLGLALVKSVIDLVGGKIIVESELHKGSIFTVVLRR